MAGSRSGGIGETVVDALKIDRDGGEDMGQVGLGATDVARPAQAAGPHALRDGAFDARAAAVERGKGDRLLPLTRGLQGAVLRLRADRQCPAGVLRAAPWVQAEGATGTRAAVDLRELDLDHGVRPLV